LLGAQPVKRADGKLAVNSRVAISTLQAGNRQSFPADRASSKNWVHILLASSNFFIDYMMNLKEVNTYFQNIKFSLNYSKQSAKDYQTDTKFSLLSV
jgi:isopropylmalate/homocitrate/citramalate synthase